MYLLAFYQNHLLGSALDAVTARTIPPSQSTLHTDSGVTLPESVHRPGFSRLHVVENAATRNSGPTGRIVGIPLEKAI